MGKATIVEAIGEGLYRATPLWNFGRIDLELLALRAQDENYWATMNAALNTLRLLRKDKAVVGNALNEIIERLEESLTKSSPAVPKEADHGNNPRTGQPYTDAEREEALKKELLELVNEARAQVA